VRRPAVALLEQTNINRAPFFIYVSAVTKRRTPRSITFSPSVAAFNITVMRVVSLHNTVSGILRFEQRPSKELDRITMLTYWFPNLNKEAMIIMRCQSFNCVAQMKPLPVTHDNFLVVEGKRLLYLRQTTRS
jgi:hypothetical protein